MNALVPLALFEAVRSLDVPDADDVAEYHRDLTAKRLGASGTVAAQIERLRRLARAGGAIDLSELSALFRLVARRHDAGLIFANAGQHAGALAVRTIPALVRTPAALLPGALGTLGSLSLARRRSAAVFNARMTRMPAGIHVTLGDPFAIVAGEHRGACTFYGAAFASMLRLLGGFEGAMLHPSCRSRGDDRCAWQTSPGENA